MRFRNLEVYISPGVREIFRGEIAPILVIVEDHWHEFFGYHGFTGDERSYHEYCSMFSVAETKKVRVTTKIPSRVTVVEKIIHDSDDWDDAND